MTQIGMGRRTFVAAGIAAGLVLPARAQSLAPTVSMRGGSNNYLPGADIVDRIGGGGFLMSGTVRRAGDGAPLAGIRIQIWAHTTEGHERDPWSHGATLTDAKGAFRLEMPQIVPAFGQPHGHGQWRNRYDYLQLDRRRQQQCWQWFRHFCQPNHYDDLHRHGV